MICYMNLYLSQISPKSISSLMNSAFLFLSVSMLTFLVLQPELLLGLLAGEKDTAAELRAIEGLRHIVAAVLLKKRQQFLTCAIR